MILGNFTAMQMTRRKFITNGVLITGGAIFTDSFWVERYFIETNEFYFGTATKNTNNIKIVQISDLHLHAITYQLKQLAKQLNKLQPDLILITGDAIDKSKNKGLLDQFLQSIDHKIKKVAVLGNWEYQAKISFIELRNIYTANNCDLLINQTKQYSFKSKLISITGLDDFYRGNADFDTAIKDYQKSDYHVVLCHCPQYADNIAAQMKNDVNVDFILAGHTHGGQLNFLGYVAYLPKGSGKYLKGWYNNSPKLYVSKGVGTGVWPFRFGSRAEISIFNMAS
jgi:predicted MPP superfamily phosphohydrolase